MVIVFAYMYLEKEQEVYLYISVILSIIYTVKSYEIIEFYFRAKVKAKYVSIANMIDIIISSILKVLLIFNEYSLIYFAITNLIEGLVAIGLLLLYFNKETQSIKLAKINFNRGVDLIKESALIFGGFFACISQYRSGDVRRDTWKLYSRSVQCRCENLKLMVLYTYSRWVVDTNCYC